MKKRILSMLLAIVMVVGLVPGFSITASAATITGQCGTSATYTLTDDGVLTVSGTGAIEKNAFGSLAKNGATKNKGFTDYLNIQKVVINEGITEVGEQAFIDCENITSVTLPSTVNTIMVRAFQNCTALETINFPEGLTAIYSYAFDECRNLESISLPSTLTSIGNLAFSNCYALKEVHLAEGIKTIGQGVFSSCKALTSITIPASVTTVNYWVFNGCKALTSITIKSNNTSLTNPSFQSCTQVITFTVPCDYEETKVRQASPPTGSTFNKTLHTDADGNRVCDKCGQTAVTGVSLDKSDITLGALDATEKLTATVTPAGANGSVTWGSSNTLVATVDGTGKVTARGKGTATITATTVEGSKTASCAVTVNLPENPVESVSLSQTTLKLGVGHQYELDATITPENADIKTVTWASDNTAVATVDTDGVVTGVAAGTATITVTTTDGGKTASCVVTVIADHTHAWNTYTGSCNGCSMTHDTHGAYTWTDGKCSVCDVIGGYCGEVYKEETVEYVLTSADQGSTYTITISGNGAMGEYTTKGQPWSSYSTKITTAVVKNGVQDIGWGAFKSHSSLTNVTIPDNITKIGSGAFSGTTSLSAITLPSALTDLGSGAFYESGIQSITIPAGVTSIAHNTFYESELSNITLGNVTSIGDDAFWNCKKLTSVTLPSTLITIGNDAFAGSALTSVTIPSSVTTIGERAFQGCNSLKSVIISGGNLTIEEQAFWSDDALETLTVTNTGKVSIGDYAFMINVTDDDGSDVIIGDVTIGGWESADGGSIDTDSGSSGSNGTTGDNTPGDDTTGDGISGGDTTGSVTITRREDKLYSIKLPANVTYATNYATSFGNRVRSISIDETAEVVIDSSITLPPPVFTPDTAYDKTITWTSSNEGVATVDSSGKVTGVSEGTATITAAAKYQLNGVYRSDSCTVTVVQHDHNWSYSLKDGTTNTLEAICGNQDGNCPNTDGGSVTITAPSDLTYTGNKIEAVVDNQLTTGATVEVTYTGNTTDGYPVNAGDYTAYITLDNATIDVEFTIKKATPGMTAPTATNPTYTGGDQLLVSGGNAVNGTMWYAVTDTTVVTAPTDGWNTEVPTGSTAKTYRVWYKVIGITNYSDTTPAYVDSTISKNSFDAEITGIDGWTYGDAADTPSVSNNPGTGEVTYYYKPTSAGDDAYTTTVPTAAGDYTVKAVIAETDNYGEKVITVDFVVAKSDSATTTTADPVVATYGDTITLTAQVGVKTVSTFATSPALDKVAFYCGETELGIVDVIYNENGTGTATLQYNTSGRKLQIGDNEVTAYYGGSVNLNGSQSDTITVTLLPKEITIEITAGGGTYGEPITPATAEPVGYVEGYKPDVILTYTGTTESGIEVDSVICPEEVGIYTVTATVEDEYYTVEGDVSERFIINDSFDYDLWYHSIMMLFSQQFKINASTTGDGSITPVGVTKVYYDRNQSYTITPDEGYVIADVIVDGESIGAVSEYTFKRVKKDHTITAVFEEIKWQNPFTDVNESDWFYEDVQFVSENALMLGSNTEGTLFSPDSVLTRAMIVTVLWRLEGEPVVNYLMPFTDVEDDKWYTEAVRWAAAEGIVNGYEDSTFRPGNEITREQVMAILHRYAVYKGLDSGVIFPMIPQYNYSLWAENDIIWADMVGLTSGLRIDLYDMTAYANRAEIAAYLRRFYIAFIEEE